MKRRTKGTGGFTMIETLTSASVLTLVVFAAAGASRVAMDCTGQVVSIEAA